MKSRRRGIALIVAGALASGLAVVGVHAALAGGSPTLRTSPDPTVASTPTAPLAPATHTPHVPRATPVQPTPDPTELADGVYPTFVTAVDVQGATVTVDVLQTFFGGAAHQAAIEDGASWKDLRFAPVYIRNENPLLRTLPVAPDVHIDLMGVCTSPDRSIGLTQLRKETTPYSETFYYDVSVVSGHVVRIMQKVAVAGC